MGQISTANHELAAGASQVNLAMQQLEQVVQANTSAATQVSAPAGQLSAQAESLRSAAAFVQTSVNQVSQQEEPVTRACRAAPRLSLGSSSAVFTKAA